MAKEITVRIDVQVKKGTTVKKDGVPFGHVLADAVVDPSHPGYYLARMTVADGFDA